MVIASFILVFIVPPVAAFLIGWWAVRRQERTLAAARATKPGDLFVSTGRDAGLGKSLSIASMRITIHDRGGEVAGRRHERRTAQAG